VREGEGTDTGEPETERLGEALLKLGIDPPRRLIEATISCTGRLPPGLPLGAVGVRRGVLYLDVARCVRSESVDGPAAAGLAAGLAIARGVQAAASPAERPDVDGGVAATDAADVVEAGAAVDWNELVDDDANEGVAVGPSWVDEEVEGTGEKPPATFSADESGDQCGGGLVGPLRAAPRVRGDPGGVCVELRGDA
jgi:hypothetical protein